MFNQVIPFVELRVEYDFVGECFLEFVRDFPACFVNLVDHTREAIFAF